MIGSSFAKNAIAQVVACAFLGALGAAAHAAQADAAELEQMRDQAARDGAVPVMVHLENVPLSSLKNDRAGVRHAMEARAEKLLDTLGSEAWAAGRWDNGAGQIGVYVTSKGIDVLLGSSNARTFFLWKQWYQASAQNGVDGSLEALDRIVRRDGGADVEVVLNVDGLESVHHADGSTAWKGSSDAVQAAAREFKTLLSSMGGAEVVDRQAALATAHRIEQAGAAANPKVTLRVNRQGLIRLADSASIRSMRPVGHVDPRARQFDATALDRARHSGSADVVIVLREPVPNGRLSHASLGEARRASRAALDDVLRGVGGAAVLQDFAEFGAIYARLSAPQLEALQASADRRVLAVVDNKPVATPQLAVSGPTMNMPSAWTAGFRGGSQNVMVFDTGVLANHPFLAGRVTFEACFGTTQAVGGVQYVSVCPQPDGAEDSPLGLAGSGAPPFGGSCSTSEPSLCSHGTHVAGIAAGRTAPNQVSGLQGTAPDANILAIQVFSFDQARVSAPGAFFVDILAGLQAAASAMVPNAPASNPYTLNMSLGGGQHFGPCTAPQWTPYITAVQTLRNSGVPVIAATGNDSFDAAISVPACLPGVVKVGSVGNDGVGNARSFFNAVQGSNVANPAFFPGETLWVAPGGGNGTSIQSSVLGGGIQGMSGTSMAAPQIAGIYADAKSADPALTVDGINAYFVANASVNVPMTARSGAPLNFSLRRILLPTF